MGLYDEILRITAGETLPLHMPGHKRSGVVSMTDPYMIDVTEIEGTDNLHAPTGIISDLMKRITDYYCSLSSYPLVGGSTVGLQSAIYATCRQGDHILIDRGCHISVYHMIELLGLYPTYLMPESTQVHKVTHTSAVYNPHISSDVLKATLYDMKKNSSLPSAVVITSPTYEGYIRDIKALATICHEYHIPLIADAAHGAHLMAYLRADDDTEFIPATLSGADIVVESLHKTLPALTQTAILHRCSKMIDLYRLNHAIDIFETSSPSYVLLSSIDQCLTWLERDGDDAFREYIKRLNRFYQKSKTLTNLTILPQTSDRDPCKIVILPPKNIGGIRISQILKNNYDIETELSTDTYVLAITSAADDDKSFDRLYNSLLDIDNNIDNLISDNEKADTESMTYPMLYYRPHMVYTPTVASSMQTETLPSDKVSGRIIAEYITPYPPGIPIYVPGEKIESSLSRYKTMIKCIASR